jgi:hypothetical protein
MHRGEKTMKKYVLLGVLAVALLAIPVGVMADGPVNIPVMTYYTGVCSITPPASISGTLVMGPNTFPTGNVQVASNYACWRITVTDANGGKLKNGAVPLAEYLMFQPLTPVPLPPPKNVYQGNVFAIGNVNEPTGVTLPLTLFQQIDSSDVGGTYTDTLTLTCQQPLVCPGALP